MSACTAGMLSVHAGRVVQVGLTMSSTTRAVVLASSVTATGAGIAGARFGFGAGDAEAVGAAGGAAVVGAAVVGGGVGDATPAGGVHQGDRESGDAHAFPPSGSGSASASARSCRAMLAGLPRGSRRWRGGGPGRRPSDRRSG